MFFTTDIKQPNHSLTQTNPHLPYPNYRVYYNNLYNVKLLLMFISTGSACCHATHGGERCCLFLCHIHANRRLLCFDECAPAELLMPPYGGNLACKEVLSWLKGRGVTSVILHTNCSGLHRYLTAPVVAIRSYVGIATDGCREIMSSFLNCYIRLICRSSNMIAHSLASKAYFQSNQ